ncbi:MAG: hypothetical protein IJ068_05050 [Bacilli bacterium]|nr:hypothetical protein [Bacilli bacterium]
METKTYLFQPEKKFLKQGFFMEDENNNIVYEAQMIKQTLIGAMPFNFINHISNTSLEHKVGHTVTTEQTGAFGMFSTKSYFKFDGKNVWDYLHEKGIRIDSNLQDNKLGMVYNVTLEGKEMATIVTSTPKGKSVITSSYYLNVTTKEENLDLAFLVAFAIARTNQAFYS